MADRTAAGTLTVEGLVKRLVGSEVHIGRYLYPPDARVHLNTHSNWQSISAEEVTFDAADHVVTIEAVDPHAMDDEDDE